MVKKRYDYSLLLDSLRNIFDNYGMTIHGEVVNKNGDSVRNNQIIANMQFGVLYTLAYKQMMIDRKNEIKFVDSNVWALTDYNIFNSFMNNCLNEYSIYSDIGTGNVLYVPYQEIAKFIFENEFRKNVLVTFLNSEKENISNIQRNNVERKVKSL